MAIEPTAHSGDRIRLNGRQAVVVGYFELGTGFSWNGMLMASEETFARFSDASVTTKSTSGSCNFGRALIRTRFCSELRAVLPADVRVFTRDEINEQERRYWLRVTSVGQFLLVAVILAVVVGVIFVYQMMAADIRNMLPEYATVKALGYRPPYLTGGGALAGDTARLLGYIPGFVAAIALYSAARNWGGIPTGMTPGGRRSACSS